MARKRLNVKFIVLGITALLCVAAAGVAYKYRKRLLYGSADKLVAKAEQLIKEGKYDDAGKALYDAATVGGPDPYIYVRLGDLWDLKAGEDPFNNIQKARGFWENALSVDPRYLPALQRILARVQDYVDVSPTVQHYQLLRESAERLLVVAPDDKDAQFKLHAATIQLKKLGGNIDQEAVDKSLKAMQQTFAEDPTNADAMIQIAESKLSSAQAAYLGNDDATMRNVMNEVAAMADGAMQNQPNNAAIHLRAGQIYYGISNVERMSKGDHKKWQERGKQALTRARELAKPDEKLYKDIQSTYAEHVLIEQDKLAEGEQIYRELIKQFPNERGLKLRVASLAGSDPKRRDEAVALLTEPPRNPKDLKGLDALMEREYEGRALTSLLGIKLDEYLSLKTPEERNAALAKIEADYNRLRSLKGDRPDVIQIQGRIQVVKGQIGDAVQSFNNALRSAEGQTLATRLHTMDLLARSYILTGQSGQAKRTLSDMLSIIDPLPEGEQRGIPYRLLLVQILLDENNANDAKPHVEVLAKHLKPDDPRLTIARLGVMTDEAQKAERKKLFDALPQTNREQTLQKAKVASQVMKDDETALKLMEGLRAADPGDIDVVVNLANFYHQKGKKDQAEKVVADALAKTPDNIQLQMAQKRLAATTPEQVAALQNEALDKITDPFRKEVRLFEIAVNDNKLDQARGHLEAAEKLKPEDVNLLDLKYRFHASQKEFDKAQEYLDRLSAKDPGRGEIERINLALARGERATALEMAQKLTRERGEFAFSYRKLAEVHGAMGRWAEAAAAYRSALERDSRNLDALLGIVNCYYRLGQPVEARRYIETARRIYPNDARVREMALGHEQEHGDPEQVIAPRKEQLDGDKESPNNWLMLGQAYFAAYRAKSAAGKDAEANAHLVKAEETFKQGYAKWPDSADFATALAQVALRLKKYDDGAKAIRDLAARPQWQGKPDAELLLADYLMAAGKDDEAEKVYRGLIERTKDIGLTLRLAELIYRKPERVNDALAVLDASKDHPIVRSRRIELLLRSKRIDDAQKELDAMAATPPAGLTPEQQRGHQAVIHDLQAAIYIGANKPVEALDAVNKSLALEPNYPMALYRRGLLRLNTRGDVQGAIADFSAVRNVVPGMTEARVELARAYRAGNDMDAALRELESAARDVPTDKPVRLALVRYYTEAVPQRWTDAERVLREAREIPTLARDPDLLVEEAKMWSARNDAARAVKTLQEAAQVAPSNLAVVQTLLDVLNKGKQHREVIKVTDNFLKTSPGHWWAYNARGIAKARLDEKDGALAEFEQGLKVTAEQNNEGATQAIIATMAQELGTAAALRRVEDRIGKGGDNVNRWRMIAARLLHAQADYAGALRFVHQVMEDPKVAGAERTAVMRLAGELYCNQSPPDFARALDLFKKLVEQNPEDVGALNNLAAVMTMPGSPARPEDALPYSERAFNIMSRGGGSPEAAVLDTHGSILVQVGRVEEGIGLIQSAIDRQPLPDAYYHLGDAYLKQSKPDDAENALRRARDLIAQAERDKQPVDPTLRQRVEELLMRASALKQQKTSGAQ